MTEKDENYKPETYSVVSRPASNKKYRVGMLLNNNGDPVRTCGHTRTHTTSKAAVDCMNKSIKGTAYKLK